MHNPEFNGGWRDADEPAAGVAPVCQRVWHVGAGGVVGGGFHVERTGGGGRCGQSPHRQTTPVSGQGETHHFLFMSGGPSHVDTFDPKPRLPKNGKPLPFEKPSWNGPRRAIFCNRRWSFKQYGRCGRRSANFFPIFQRAWMTCASSARWWQTTSIITAPASR